MKTKTLVLLALIVSPLVHAGPKKAAERLRQAPEAVRKTVADHSRGGVVDDFDTIRIDGKTIHVAEIELPLDLKLYVSEDGALIKIREEIPTANAPAAVLDAARPLGDSIKEVEKETAGESITYRVEVKRKGQADLDLHLTADGKILSQKLDVDK
jgi:hypothetical protein